MKTKEQIEAAFEASEMGWTIALASISDTKEDFRLSLDDVEKYLELCRSTPALEYQRGLNNALGWILGIDGVGNTLERVENGIAALIAAHDQLTSEMREHFNKE